MLYPTRSEGHCLVQHFFEQGFYVHLIGLRFFRAAFEIAALSLLVAAAHGWLACPEEVGAFASSAARACSPHSSKVRPLSAWTASLPVWSCQRRMERSTNL